MLAGAHSWIENKFGVSCRNLNESGTVNKKEPKSEPHFENHPLHTCKSNRGFIEILWGVTGILLGLVYGIIGL